MTVFPPLLILQVTVTISVETLIMTVLVYVVTDVSLFIIFHLRRPMAFLFISLYDTPGCAPRINVLFRGLGDFPISYSNRDTSSNA